VLRLGGAPYDVTQSTRNHILFASQPKKGGIHSCGECTPKKHGALPRTYQSVCIGATPVCMLSIPFKHAFAIAEQVALPS
jgi:hypothetical protein